MRKTWILPVLLALTASATAHEFWIDPSTFRPAKDERVSIDLRVGDGFPGEAVMRDPARFVRFASIDPAGREAPVIGFDSKAPAGLLRPLEEGAWWIVYRSQPKSIELPAEKFEAYLKEEGLERVIEARKTLGEASQDGREAYSRCAKSLLRVGGAASDGFDRKVGLPLELVLETRPEAMRSGEEVSLRLLFRDAPLEGALVRCSSPETIRGEEQRTDREGRVRMHLRNRGLCLFNAVHMVRSEAGSASDWESLWASLTLEVP